MKILDSFFLQCVLVIAALISPFGMRAATPTAASGQSSDSSWPREKYIKGNRLIAYQPQVDDWKNFQDLSWRMAISLTPNSGNTVVGVVEMKGNTTGDNVGKGFVPSTFSIPDGSGVVPASEVLAAGSGARVNNLGLGFESDFPYNQQTQSTQ